jgi:hypothetical protein
MAHMDEGTAINVGAAALVAAYVIHWFRLRQTKLRMRDFLAGCFNGDLPFDQFARPAQEFSSRRFMGSPSAKPSFRRRFSAQPRRSWPGLPIPLRPRGSFWLRSPT